jgi:PAS domain S-box-containing protein
VYIASDKKAALLHEQVTLLFNGIPNSLMANVLGSAVALFVYQGAVSPVRLYLWVGMLLTITLGRWIHYRRFLRASPPARDIEPWFTQFRIGTILLGAAVGSAGFLLFVYDDVTFELTLALMMVCLAAFAASSLSPRPELAVLFLILILAPLLGTLLLTHSGPGNFAFWLMAALLVMLIISAFRLGKNIARGIELTIDAQYRELDLRNFQQRLALYVTQTPLAVIEWDEEMQIQEWNPAAEHIFGYTKEQARGHILADLLFSGKNAARLPEIWRDLKSNSGGHQRILEHRTRKGEVIQCEWFNTLLSDTGGAVFGVMSVVQDVTRRLENEKLKEEFVSIVSHELRTPVTSIKGSLALLASGILADEPEKSREMLDLALVNANRLQLLINDILDVEKFESGKMEYRFRMCDLARLMEDALAANQSYAAQYGVNLAGAGLAEVHMVRIDPDRLFQVVTNILSNAIKFSITGGTVTLALAQDGERVRVSVNNRGEVIPDADRAKLFGKFFQRDSSTTRTKGGTGLGLYISQKILEEHGSQLDFISNNETGTTFFFALASVPAGGPGL